MISSPFRHARSSESGNILFMILIAVVLIGLLTSVILSTGNTEGSNIDEETLVIRASEVQRAAAEMERAVLFILSNEKSETELRFAHQLADPSYGDLATDTDLERQVFHSQGGGAAYRLPPEGINDGSAWEFYGNTAIPGMGSSKADLIALLPNVTQQFCEKINALNEQSMPEDTGTCLHAGASGRFNDSQQFDDAPNSLDEATFTQDPNAGAAKPAPQACVRCGSDNHFYHVLLAR